MVDNGFFSIESKISKAQKLIYSIASRHEVGLAFSGGKDSSVLYWLAKQTGASFKPFHCVTTIDPPEVISFCEFHGCDIVRPKLTFLELVRKKGMPSMFKRFCCSYLKEKYYSPYVLMGIRRAESIRRAKCYSEVESIRYYSKKVFTNAYYPLLNWSDDDIEYCVNRYNIKCHPLYYDQKMKFHVERRLGCIGCPLQGDRGRKDYKQYPRLARLVLANLVLFHESHNRSEKEAALDFIYQVFYSNHRRCKFEETFNGLFPHDPWIFIYDNLGVHKDEVMHTVYLLR